jgi:probable addiction module antidote protein
MTVATRPFDPAEYVEGPEGAAAYLAAAFASGDEAAVAAALGVVARAQGMTELANATGFNRAQLYRTLSPAGHPTLASVLKIMAALGVRLQPVPAEPGQAA